MDLLITPSYATPSMTLNVFGGSADMPSVYVDIADPRLGLTV